MLARLPRWILLVLFATGIALSVWRVYAWQPERYVPNQFATLIARMEANRWRMAGWLIADDYSDRWGFNKKSLIESGSSVFRHFRWLEIKREGETWSRSEGSATVTVILDLKGEGTQLATIAKDTAAEATAPFVFTWKKTGPMPWHWKLSSIDQPQLNLRRWQGAQ